MRSEISFFIYLISLFLIEVSFAQSICTSENLFKKNVSWFENIAEVSIGKHVFSGANTMTCGVSGQQLNICFKCENKIKGKEFDVAKSMLSSPKHTRWVSSWKAQHKSEKVSMTINGFIEEKIMKHVAPGESQSKFTDRINENWGESFFFMHREALKMINLELSTSGRPCLGLGEELPGIPKGFILNTKEEKKVKKITDFLKMISRPEKLKNMSLNDLSTKLTYLFDQLKSVYSTDQARCQEVSSKDCDSLGSITSEHKNQKYWQIFTYLDKYIGKWLQANGYNKISKLCDVKDKECYQWKGNYTAGYPF